MILKTLTTYIKMSDSGSGGYRYEGKGVRYKTADYNTCTYSSDHNRFVCLRVDTIKTRVLIIINTFDNYTITVNSTSHQLVKDQLTIKGSSFILDYNSPLPRVKIENAVLLTIKPEDKYSPLQPYLGCFIVRLYGSCWVTHSYSAESSTSEGIIIINKPLFGSVLLHVLTESEENSFYLQYERTDEGKLSGELIRARAIPFHEAKKEREYEDFRYNVPVYVSYYHPVSGQQVSREEYEVYIQGRKKAISLATSFPPELCTLLGYL